MSNHIRPDIIQVLERYGYSPRYKREGWSPIACPFHDDSRASASVHAEYGKLRCHGCGWRGDAYDIIAQKEGITFKEALDFGDNLKAAPKHTPYKAEEVKEIKPLSDEESIALETSTLYYQTQLDQALPYLSDRGISRETAERFRLGYHPKTHRLILPYINENYEVEDVRFRCIAAHDCRKFGHGKYMTRTGSQARLFNRVDLARAVRRGFVVITEGELDAITLYEVGIPAIGVPGAQAWRPEYANLFTDIPQVYVFADGDTAGEQFMNSVMRSLPKAKGVLFPDGMDVNDLYLEKGSEGIYNQLAFAKMFDRTEPPATQKKVR